MLGVHMKERFPVAILLATTSLVHAACKGSSDTNPGGGHGGTGAAGGTDMSGGTGGSGSAGDRGGSVSGGAGAGGTIGGGGAGAIGGFTSCQSDNACVGFKCCDGRCVNPNNDILNCGTCGTTCAGPNPYCNHGTCGSPPCEGTACSGGTTCCGTECCGGGELCCTVTILGPERTDCFQPVNGSCPPGCTGCT